MMRRLAVIAALPIGLLAIAWGAAALWIDGPGGPALRAGLALGYIALSGALAFALRPRVRAVFATLALFAVVLVWWLSLAPSNDREWLTDVAELPRAHIDGDRVTIENLRNFHYRSETDYDARWDTRTYDLSQVQGLDMFLSYWDSPTIAHTIASWQFAQGPPLAISIETRKEVGEAYSAVLGFFRQFELYYVVADEHDLVGLRASHRGEQLRLYHLKHSPEQARVLLLDYLRRINELAEEADWYNAATHNCTTTIRLHMQHVGLSQPFDWRVLLNGRIDEWAYERGRIDTSMPFEELRIASDVTERARQAAGRADFSSLIRIGLPGGYTSADEGTAPR
jgi:hypothetical protein